MMKYLLLTLLFSVEALAWMKTPELIVSGKSNSGKWIDISRHEKVNIENLLSIIKRSNSGKLLILAAERKAEEQGGSLIDFIKEGRGSLTDTTLLRRFTVSQPDKIQYETKSVVYINRELSIKNAILDLSHELTHFVYREAFNPYHNGFTLEQFIKSTIEGRGGEVQAFMTECQVLKELYPEDLNSRSNCVKIFDKDTKSFSQSLAVKRFYQIGSFYRNFKQKLSGRGIASHFEHITDLEASFISSAYGVPYPVAAYSEYVTVLNKVCENDKKRLGLMKVQKGRSIASDTNLNEKLASYKSRCEAYL